MKQNGLLSTLLVPVLVILLGLVLVVNPDSVSALASNVLGWVLIGIAVVSGIAAVVSPEGRFRKVALAIACAVVGGWLHANPLALASALGRLCGIFLLLQGLPDLFRGNGRSLLLAIAVTAVGAGLLLMPMSASRLLFTLCGVVVIVIGAAMLLDRLKGRRRLDPPEDPFTVDPL